MNRLMNLIDVAYTIDNFDSEMPIYVIFSTFAHLCNSQTKVHYFGKISNKFCFR